MKIAENISESPLSSKVAMFNNQADQHKQAQLLNPFATTSDGRASPKPTFSKDQYGKPLAGSLTEMRGQKANIHVMKEMLELCQIINSEGYTVKDEPNMRVIPFGELFNIYNYISDKVVGILLRARKHKLVDFEGEMLFQRRDDDVPVFLLRPIQDIRKELDEKIEEIKRSCTPSPVATSLLLDSKAHQQKLQDAGLLGPGGSRKNSKSRSVSPASQKSKPPTPAPSPVSVEVVPPPAEAQISTAAANQQVKDVATVINSVAASTETVSLAAQQLSAAAAVSTSIATPNDIDNKVTDVNNNGNVETNTTIATNVTSNDNTVLPTIIVDDAAPLNHPEGEVLLEQTTIVAVDIVVDNVPTVENP